MTNKASVQIQRDIECRALKTAESGIINAFKRDERDSFMINSP